MGPPGGGKSTLALFPHERLGSVLHVTCEPGAQAHVGIPKSWIEGRVKTVAIGFAEKGGRLRGKAYDRAWEEWASKPFDEDTLVLDTMSGVCINRHADALQELGGPTEFRKENEAPQRLAVVIYHSLYEANTGKNILILHHSAPTYKPMVKGASERRIDTYVPVLTGSRLHEIWGGRFDGCLELDWEPAMVDGGKAEERTRKFVLRLSPHQENRLVWIRHGLGTQPPAELDLTIKKPKDYTPLKGAWDKIFDILDSSQEG